MNNFNRLTIDAITQAFSEHISTGEVNVVDINNAHKQLNFELDRRIAAKEPAEEIEALIKDVLWVKYDLLELK